MTELLLIVSRFSDVALASPKSCRGTRKPEK
jgi:hypothetical protein